MRSGVSFGKTPAANEHGSTRVYPRVLVIVFLIVFSAPVQLARADYSRPDMISASSASGQFIVTGSPQSSPLASIPDVANNDNIVRLDPALLAVSADRIRIFLMQKLGVSPLAPYGGKIYLALHPARALDENVAVFPSRFENTWVYHVLLPDVLPRERLVRTLASVLLLEYANRSAGEHSADVPPWLVEGLSQELMADSLKETVVSTPDQTVNGLSLDRVNVTQRGMDTLTGTRAVLQNYSVLTFAQLSWPTDLQLSGEDGGAYRASAQLFVDELLGLRNGSAKLRAMMEMLPRYYNWQTAFQSAFHDNFSAPLDTEKWWALQSVIFISRSPGPQWTAAASRLKLDEILSVAVEFRTATNNLPAPTEVSLQSVIQNFDPALQQEILQTKLRDLELAQFQMAPSLAVLTAEYRDALAGYLGQAPLKRVSLVLNKHLKSKVSARDTIRKLDVLDAQRRAVTIAARPGFGE